MTSDIFPVEMILERELLNNQLKKVVLYHNTDRWYFGDFIRHATWLSSLHAIQPESLELVTAAAYLPLYDDGRVHVRHDIASFDPSRLAEYDLVIIPSAYPPSQYDQSISRAIYTWDRGWAYVRYGLEIQTGTKNKINYFIAARHTDQTALPDSNILPLSFRASEISSIAEALIELFGNRNPVIVYNPTASNPYTRETTIKKEVDNSLTTGEHGIILAQLQLQMPGYNFLVGSAVKPGDALNEAAISRLASEAGDNGRVKSIFDLKVDGASSMRGFAAILAATQVKGMIGAGTGTNTHLASLVGLPSFSIERSADEAMIENWKHPEQFQMGSFRWRNPADEVAICTLDWDKKSVNKLTEIADSFVVHIAGMQHDLGKIFQPDYIEHFRRDAAVLIATIDQHDTPGAKRAMKTIVGGMKPGAARHYGNFSDEMAYLHLLGAQSGQSFEFTHLLEFSNLHKLCRLNTSPKSRENAVSEITHIFKKLRAGVKLDQSELAVVGAKDEMSLAADLNSAILPRIRKSLETKKVQHVVSGWQHSVGVYDDMVVKTFDANPLSEYLSDEYTRIGIDTALTISGGFIPHSYMDGDNLISKRIALFISREGGVMPLYDGKLQEEVVLPYGWVREQLAHHVEMLRHGIFNFDFKLTDTGIDHNGVFVVVDFSVFRAFSQKVTTPGENPRTDLVRLALGELVRSGQLLRRFKNGSVLLNDFCADIKSIFDIDIFPLVENWQWGDHGDEKYDQMVAQFTQALEGIASQNLPSRPVYGLINQQAERYVFKYLSDNAADRQELGKIRSGSRVLA